MELMYVTNPKMLTDRLTANTPTSNDPTTNDLHECLIALTKIVAAQAQQITNLKAAFDEHEGRQIAKAEGRRYD